MKNKAVFLDRDGVVNFEMGTYTWKMEQFKYLPDIFYRLQMITEKGYLIIIVSNQGGIGKGIYDHRDVQEITQMIKEDFENNKVRFTDFLYCPHHPEFNGKCLCRKPDSLLFEKAVARYNIDPEQSFMIGDKERDILAAEKCGIKSFLIPSNQSIKNIVPLIP